MEYYKERIENISNAEELIEGINSLKKTLKKIIEFIKGEMAWARLRYDEGGADYSSRIEFADFYFKLNDILEEVYNIDKLKDSDVTKLKLKLEEAYSSLRESVATI